VFSKISTEVKKKIFLFLTKCIMGARGGALGRGTALQARRSRIQFPMVSLVFFIDIILPAALWP